MFDFGRANISQKEAIKTTEGPLLLIAGPGTGKTFTLVQRTVYLIQEKHVNPNDILIATFTEKAAKELVTRITDELAKRNISVNLNEMYVGTFHSICLRLLKENLAYTRIKKNFRVLDQFDQQYMVYQNLYKFKNIPYYSQVVSITEKRTKSKWDQAQIICKYVNNLSEELVDYKEMQLSGDTQIAALGNVLETYKVFLEENNYLDFSSIQIEAYTLLKNVPEILKKLQKQLKYIMIDEYQDTNYIQEQLIFLLAGEKKNICVVGDDDQGLYRFRGATIRNILEFPSKFPDGACKKIELIDNYRSHEDIVDFYNTWMKNTAGSGFKFSWKDLYRYDKEIIAKNSKELQSPTVIRITGNGSDPEAWYKEILKFIQALRDSGKLTDYNQLAFLFRSVKHERVVGLSAYLEEHGVNVYSPRSDMFFERDDIKKIIGCFLILFGNYTNFIYDDDFIKYFSDLRDYYDACIKLATPIFQTNPEFAVWAKEKIIFHATMPKNTDYAFTGLLYQLIAFSPFREYLDSDLQGGVNDLRPQRNIAMLTEILQKYEYLYNLDVFTTKYIGKEVERFFKTYLRLIIREGITEYEDDSEYAPSGCVSFLTIHQSKGMEFPVVVVSVDSASPRKQTDDLLQKVALKYFHRKPFEPLAQIKFFDFWRLYYTAYSRAQNLLVLTSRSEDNRGCQPSKYFSDFYYDLPEYNNPEVNVSEFEFADVKDVNLKQTYSFTSHILLYERCSKQYKFFKELGFTPSRVGPTIFGVIVHQTIEDVHRAAIRGETDLITPDNIEKWLRLNYATVSKSEHAYLGEKQLEAAVKQVKKYVELEEKAHNHDWSHIQDTEVDVGLVKENYILEGTVDLIRGEGDKVDIVDFKSEKKPDMFNERERIALYKKQLQIYAHLVEERRGQKVGKMILYYTGTESGVPTVTFEKNKSSIEETISEFSNIVSKIQKKDFSKYCESAVTCSNCDMRYYCKR